jgi:uncharacterized protein (UPF0332 family)
MKDDLLRRAQMSLQGRRRIRSVFLRRSVSDAYYALFHALAALCADSLIGVTKRDTEAWRGVYRGLEHARMKDEFKKQSVRQLHQGVARLAAAFVQLQEARHSADYDPTALLTRRADAEAFVNVAEAAINDLDALPADIGAELATCLLVKNRP